MVWVVVLDFPFSFVAVRLTCEVTGFKVTHGRLAFRTRFSVAEFPVKTFGPFGGIGKPNRIRCDYRSIGRHETGDGPGTVRKTKQRKQKVE